MVNIYEEIQIPLKAGNIAGCWYGSRSERPLLALHGWQDNAGTFALLAPILSRYTPILAIDFPGHGKSSHHPPGIIYHTIDYVRAIREIMLSFKWSKISLLGHSMGAAISFHFSSLFPQMVDMLISIDILHTRYFPINAQLYYMRFSTDKFFMDAERKLSSEHKTPPLYTFEQLQTILYEASEKSIDFDKTKYILERNITWSNEHQMYYFCRDNSIKLLQEMNTEPGICIEMAKRLNGIKWLVIKGGDSSHIDEESAVTKTIKEWHEQNNPNFVFHVLPGLKHHCHLNNPNEVAACILPFLAKHRVPGRVYTTESKL
ncbi:probable serine hydrolase [Musca vetustissima]|uniref:probable serine hydrolase n=1 Tax=Musca vetustissima TaxID=27455 RepID=UPI002AB7E26C|nr:probable serine hydrolase [Musca vetustissima]